MQHELVNKRAGIALATIEVATTGHRSRSAARRG
jgi:hypothetical protein